MIPVVVLQSYDVIPYNHLIPVLKKFSLEELEETRQELLQFRTANNELRYKSVYAAIVDILNNTAPEVMNLK